MNASSPPDSVEDLVELLRWRAEVSPEDDGFRFLENGEGDGQPLSFAQLDRRARAIAARLRRDVDPGQRVILLYPPSLAYVEAFFGCLYAGAIAVPAYPPDPRRLQRTLPRLLSIIEDSSAAAALATSNITAMAHSIAEEAVELAGLDWIATDDIDDELHRHYQRADIDADTVAFLQYTSGSTGAPKGVVLDHRTLMKNEQLIQGAFGAGPEDVGVNWLPLYHDMGLIGAVIAPVYCGCDSVLMSPLDFLKYPPRWLEAIDRFGGTKSTAPNFGYDLAVRKTPESLRDRLDLSSWDVACNGAEPIRASTLRRFAEYFEPAGFDPTAFMPAYGLAEVGLIVSATPSDQQPRTLENDQKEHVSCGMALGDFDIRIVDPDTRRELPEGEVGEIWLRDGSVAPGYWDNDERTEQTFGATLSDGDGPFLKTGDLGFIDDGELVISGRLKDLIVIRGVNHYPQDIEATVEEVHPAMRPGCGAAFAVDVNDHEELVVVQEVKPSEVDDVDELVADVSEQIAGAHRLVPREVVLIEPRTIEKTSSGKIQRFAVRDSYLNDELAVVARADDTGGETVFDPQPDGQQRGVDSSVQQWLVERVAEEAGLEPEAIELKQPFSAYGIDSAAAVGIVGELEQQLGTEIPATALYDFPTISALAAYLEDEHQQRQRANRWSSSGGGTPTDEPVAIVGMACRFPGAGDVEQFWQLLQSGKDAFSAVPEGRWDAQGFTDPEVAGFDTMATDRGGFLEDIDAFDAAFFGISPGEARAMDPQQRLVLETSWHAIENAGFTSEWITGSATGVFIGQSASDFARLYDGPPVRAASGLAPSISANRLSYWLDLHGPSATVDTACSSSLVALDQALLNLRNGRCDQAIVGGVNVILAPDTSVAFSRARMLSPEGVCRVFDDGADGYVRGEGCGVVMLKRLGDALEDGDRIRAVVRGAAVNQDGRTNGLTAPSGTAQQEVIEAALADAGVDPHTVGAVEAHGTGTELGDAIEVRALQQVFDSRDEEEMPRWLGSVKAAIGHLEAGAGVAGLIKAVLVAERGVIPPQPNFETPNSKCDFEAGGFQVPRRPRKWPGRDGGSNTPRRIGISAFGFGGTNVHAVVEEPPRAGRIDGPKAPPDRPGLVGLAADEPQRLEAFAASLVDRRELFGEDGCVRDLGATLARCRDGGPVRFAAAADNPGALRKQLQQQLLDADEPVEQRVQRADQPPTVGLAFGEEGFSAVALSRLADQFSAFRNHLEQLVELLEDAGATGLDGLLEHIGGGDGVEKSELSEPALFALQLAVARTLEGWGVAFDAASGEGVCQLAAAVVDGDMALEEAVDLIVDGRSAEGEPAGFAECAEILAESGVDIVVALTAGEPPAVFAGEDDGAERPDWIPALAEGDETPLRLLEAVGRLWERGVDCELESINAGGSRIELPNTPFLRESYWPNDNDMRTMEPGG